MHNIKSNKIRKQTLKRGKIWWANYHFILNEYIRHLEWCNRKFGEYDTGLQEKYDIEVFPLIRNCPKNCCFSSGSKRSIIIIAYRKPDVATISQQNFTRKITALHEKKKREKEKRKREQNKDERCFDCIRIQTKHSYQNTREHKTDANTNKSNCKRKSNKIKLCIALIGWPRYTYLSIYYIRPYLSTRTNKCTYCNIVYIDMYKIHTNFWGNAEFPRDTKAMCTHTNL